MLSDNYTSTALERRYYCEMTVRASTVCVLLAMVACGKSAADLSKAKAFESNFVLTLTSNGLGEVRSEPLGISCSLGCMSGSAVFASGESVRLNASPPTGGTIAWSGACTVVRRPVWSRRLMT